MKDTTRGLLDGQHLQLLRQGATILCLSRFEIFEIDALLKVTSEKGLNVWFDGVDDVALKSKLESVPGNVLITPSPGARTQDAQERLVSMALRSIQGFDV